MVVPMKSPDDTVLNVISLLVCYAFQNSSFSVEAETLSGEDF